jgi:hypothetical protein
MTTLSRIDTPRIDTPCPLDADAQRAIDGHCSHCDKHVHRLDGLSVCERRALFANATGPICVSYRKPAPRRVGRIGAVIAATLITSVVQAGDPSRPSTTTTTVAEALQTVKEDPDESADELDVLIMGGIRAPQALLDEEDVTLPELPVRSADDIPVAEGATRASRDTTPSSQPQR